MRSALARAGGYLWGESSLQRTVIHKYVGEWGGGGFTIFLLKSYLKCFLISVLTGNTGTF